MGLVRSPTENLEQQPIALILRLEDLTDVAHLHFTLETVGDCPDALVEFVCGPEEAEGKLASSQVSAESCVRWFFLNSTPTRPSYLSPPVPAHDSAVYYVQV